MAWLLTVDFFSHVIQAPLLWGSLHEKVMTWKSLAVFRKNKTLLFRRQSAFQGCIRRNWMESAVTSIQKWYIWARTTQIYPGLSANEIQVPYDKHHKALIGRKSPKLTQFCRISSNMKMSNNLDKYEVRTKQYLRSILDISEMSSTTKDYQK